MYKPKYFKIQELVSPEIFHVLGPKLSLLLIPDFILEQLDNLRGDLGSPIIINNWHNGGDYKYSGVRPYDCRRGALNSTHKLATTFDLKTRAQDTLREHIISDYKKYQIERIEDFNYTKSWTHVQFGTPLPELKIFKP